MLQCSDTAAVEGTTGRSANRHGKQKGILQIRPNRIDSTNGLTRSLRNSPAQRHFCGDREKFLGAGIGWLEMLGSCEFKRRRKVTDEGLTATWE